MWNLLKKSGKECGLVQDALEEAATKNSGTGAVEELIVVLPAAVREHIVGCEDCQAAAQDLTATREIFKGVVSVAEEARPWFAVRVMAAIAARERELAERVSAWSEFPRFAARLAWVSAVLLLAGTTWFYEKGVTARSNPPNSGTQESIFEPSQQTNQDDILVSMAESNP
jgi:hypothetical protein